MAKQIDMISMMDAWEQGGMPLADEIDLFQAIEDQGLTDQLQGMYGRHGHQLMDAGLVRPRVVPRHARMWHDDHKGGTLGRVYGGNPNLVHIADGTRKLAGLRIKNYTDNLMRMLADESNTGADTRGKRLCPGCYMVALFNAAIHLADANGQSRRELGNTMGQAFALLSAHPQDGLTEEIDVLIDPE